jgi:preprotein translocase subunit SecD
MEIYLLDQSKEPKADIKTANSAMLSNEPHSMLMSMNNTRERTQLLVGAEGFKPEIRWGKTSQGQPVVFFELRDDVKDRVAQLTAKVANQNRHVVIFVDCVYLCDFLVEKAWTDGRGEIRGPFQDVEQAEVMANRLRAGLEMHA